MGSLNPVVDFGQRSAFLFFVAFQELNLEVSSVKVWDVLLAARASHLAGMMKGMIFLLLL